MRKVALWCVGLVLSFALAAPVAVQAADSKGAQAADMPPTLTQKAQDLAKWNGKFPTYDAAKGKYLPEGTTFWDDPFVKAMMKNSLSPEMINIVTKGWNDGQTEPMYSQIEVRGDLLFVSACRPHVCAYKQAMLYFNLTRMTVQACWADLDAVKRKTYDFWIGKKVRALPDTSCAFNPDFKAYDRFADKGY